MKKGISTFVTLFFSIFCFSQSSLEKMKEPIVKVTNNQNTIEKYTLLTNKKTGANIQIATLSYCDINLIHRDYFVAFHSTYNAMLLLGIIEEAGGEKNVLMEELAKPIGEPDVKIIMNFSEDGMQMSLLSPDGRENETITWDELYKNYR